MKGSAYHDTSIYHLAVLKETKAWAKHGFITPEQFVAISDAYKSPLYHPNIFIRLLIFVASLFAISGLTGLLGLMFSQAGKEIIYVGCIGYGIGSFVVLEKMLIGKNHFKSGATEAVMYHACAFVIGGIAGFADFDSVQLMLWACLAVFSFSAIRYLDLLTTIAAMGAWGGILFYSCFETGGILRQIIPFVFIFSFSAIYFLVKKIKSNDALALWTNNLVVVEVVALLMIYAGGNYFVVRELSVNLMNLVLAEGEDIPFAFFFYALTVVTPIVYLVVGVKNKDVVLLRVSLLLIAFSVFTFKYYYSLGHTEVMLLVAGSALVGIAVALMNHLKVMRGGFTGKDIFSSKWANLNAEAFLISQTIGGNQTNNNPTPTQGGGGTFGGGGSTDSF